MINCFKESCNGCFLIDQERERQNKKKRLRLIRNNEKARLELLEFYYDFFLSLISDDYEHLTLTDRERNNLINRLDFAVEEYGLREKWGDSPCSMRN